MKGFKAVYGPQIVPNSHNIYKGKQPHVWANATQFAELETNNPPAFGQFAELETNNPPAFGKAVV
ncbi:MAG: hypothetical protein B6247_21495 [Candidatus Parabeggiatoa sp. nov. 2]|nr:MAG: hypothetical protein B6247_21495 [Beggiatoa sp. 4572_84]